MKERYEQEIEQLLSELESERPESAGEPAPVDSPPPLDDQPSPFAPKPKFNVRMISPGKLALIGLAVAVIGLLLPVLKWISFAGIAIMVVAIVWMVLERMGSRPPSYWRGRPIDEAPQGTWQRFRRWLTR